MTSGTVLISANIVWNWRYIERGRFLLEKAFLILSNQHWLRSWHYSSKDPLNLMVVAATFSWTLLVDALWWKFLVGKAPSPRQSEFHWGGILRKSESLSSRLTTRDSFLLLWLLICCDCFRIFELFWIGVFQLMNVLLWKLLYEAVNF